MAEGGAFNNSHKWDKDPSQQTTTHQPDAEVPIPVAHEAVDDKNGGYADIPDHMRHRHDRGKQRSDSELKSVFLFTWDDNRSVDIPRVLQFVCAYCIGLQTIKQQLQNVDSPRDVSMETDVPETEPPELVDDNASDADYIYCGMASKEYLERLNAAKEAAKIYSWIDIYEQFIGECCRAEKSLAQTVQQLRNYPDGDVKYFCRNHLITHTKSMIERWKLLSAISTKLHSEMTTLKGSAYPCMVVYSDIELTFETDEYLQRFKPTGHSIIPEKWKQIDDKHSNTIRRIKTQIICTLKKLHDRILTTLMGMDATRKENYVSLCTRSTGLAAILSKLTNILEICRGGHALHESLSEEEIWYNEFNHSYVDMYYNSTDVRLCQVKWSNTAKQARHNLSSKVVKHCAALHQQYGDLVKELRTRRESPRPNIKTHVSELESRVVQQQSDTHQHVSELEARIIQLQREKAEMANNLTTKESLWYEKDLRTQQTNASLTSQLDDAKYNADYLKEQLNFQWNQYFKQQTDELNRKFETKLAEAMNRVTALRREKENLLTRLSKIAGSKLVHGNPAITDLSDTNRPTKLSERYSELYDNEWTDAVEELIEREDIVQGGDVACTKILLAILIESFKFCCETEAEYVRTIRQSLTSLPGSNPDTTEEQEQIQTGGTCPTLTHDQNQQLDDLVKTCVPLMTAAVESKFLTLMERKFEHVINKATLWDNTDRNQPSKLKGNQPSNLEENQPSTLEENQPSNLEENQPSNLEESDPILKSQPAMPGQSPEEQAASQGGTTTLDQEQKDHTDTKINRQFSHGHSKEMLVQDIQLNEDTCHGSHSADTTGHGSHSADNTGHGSHSADTTGHGSHSADITGHGSHSADTTGHGSHSADTTGHGSHSADTTGHVRFSSLEKTNKFTKACVNLCWLMRIQNPPLHIDTELAEDSIINTDFYKNYTRKGTKVGYLVWPALFLHKGGPLLSKGIVQPLSNKKD